VVVLLLQIGWNTSAVARSILSRAPRGQVLAPDEQVQVADAFSEPSGRWHHFSTRRLARGVTIAAMTNTLSAHHTVATLTAGLLALALLAGSLVSTGATPIDAQPSAAPTRSTTIALLPFTALPDA
jgi:hypothetical protein